MGETFGVRVLPESWTSAVAAFVQEAIFPPEEADVGAAVLLWSRDYAPQQAHHFAPFNIRARHFRCQDTWFVQSQPDGALSGAVAFDGLRGDRPVVGVNLVVSRMSKRGIASELERLLSGAMEVAREYVPLSRLRFAYPFDPASGEPIGVRACGALLDPFNGLLLEEEARIPNETGRRREFVMLAFRPREMQEAALCDSV